MNRTIFWNGSGLVLQNTGPEEAAMLTRQLLQQHPRPKKANYRVCKELGKAPVFELIF